MAGFTTRFYLEQGHLVRVREQFTRPMILEEVQRRRNWKTGRDAGALGRPAVTIPALDYQQLIERNPDLDPKNRCPETQHRAWLKFYRSSESMPYRNFRKI